MKAKILDTFKEGDKYCYLSSISLDDYILNLPEDYNDYEVQREIVSNTYLDDLVTTLLLKKHIPPIVLVVEKDNYIISSDEIKIDTFKILDGLQRTFRLKTIFSTITLLVRELKVDDSILKLSKLSISIKYKKELESINSSSALLIKILNHYRDKVSEKDIFLENLFKRDQWFEIWTELTPDEEVNKMLILNAGHKPVKTKHQLELLFRNIFDNLKKIEFKDLKVIREKEKSSIEYTKNRKMGEFHFSHLITSILSFAEGKPLTSNVNLVQKSQTDYFNDEIFDKFLRLDFLKHFIKSLLKLDGNLLDEYGKDGTRWLGRETSLIGMFAALGKYMKENNLSPIEALEDFDNKIINNVASLNLTDFEDKRNSLDLAKINIGNINKRAISKGIYDILNGNNTSINWEEHFKY